MKRNRHVLRLLITLAWGAAVLVEWQQLPGAAAQGLTDGGLLGGQSCDAARLEEFDAILLLSDDYSGGRGGGRGGSGGGRGRRKLLQGLLSNDATTAVTVTAAAMPVPKTNMTCRGSTSSLEAAFHVAAAPDAFYPQSPAQLPRVRDQGDCASCVGHAVAACTEASLAAFTGASAQQYNFSGGSLYYCGSGGRTCNTAWTVAAAMDAVRQDASILRTCQDVAIINQGVDVRRECDSAAARCVAGTNPDASPATAAAPVCAVVPAIDSIAKIQLHIRQHGAVVSRLNVNNPELFNTFFLANPTGVFNDSSACLDWSACGQPFGHAILLVGYNNSGSHWIAQSTWAREFADGGRFRIAYGIAGVGSAPDTYALACQPQDRREQRRRRLPLVALGDGCYSYTVDTVRTPHLSAVAAALNINITELVRDNLNSPAAPLVQMLEVVNSSIDQAGYGCWSQPDCTEPVPVEGCLLSVVNQTGQAGEASTSSCNMTWLQPNLSAPLVDGMLLKVCSIPDVTWKGADERLSGSAAPVCPAGQQPDEHGGCQKCLPGTFKELTGHQDCSTCAAGSFQPQRGATSCQACPAGSTSAEDTPADHDEQSDCGCPPGQVLASLVSSSSAAPADDGCITCPDDTFKPWTSAGPCLACPFGSVARGGSPAAHDNESDCMVAFAQLATGLDTWGIIAADGSLRCFGNGPSDERPILPPTLQSARWLQLVHRQVSFYNRVVCGLVMTERSSSAGVLRCFGAARYVSIVPAELNQTLFTHLASSDSLTCGVKAADGAILCFSDAAKTWPLPAIQGSKFAHVAVGGSIACGIVMRNRSLVCVNGSDAGSLLLEDASVAWQAVQVGGSGQVCGLTTAGDLLCPRRGVGDAGKDIDGNFRNVDLPTNLPGAKYKSFGLAGNFMCAALLHAAGIHCWSSRSNQTQLVPGSENSDWASIAVDQPWNDAYAVVVCATASDGLAGRCWHAEIPRVTHFNRTLSNIRIVISMGTSIEIDTMRNISMPAANSLSQWHQLEVGSLATCGIRTTGRTLVCVGKWLVGKFTQQIFVPPALASVPLSAVSLSSDLACVILAESGRVKCFGSWFRDPAPIPTIPPSYTYAQVVSDAVFDSVSTGVSHACGVLSGSRKLLCWGNGFVAAVFPPSLASAPVQSVVSNAVGDYSGSCAMLTGSAAGKRVVCWFYDGSYVIKTTLDTVAVALGNQTICAVQSSKANAIACWVGSLRIKGIEPPASVGNRDWRSVSLATYHACGVRRIGRAYCWPLKTHAFPDEQTNWDQDKLPSDLGEFGTVRDLQVGLRHTCILTAGQGNIQCFGLNDMGQAPDMLIA